ncbi:Pre-mRNA-splicing factor of RES complex-domain-containing protein [Crepidotus variabilis]|uniref:Pre-mRNA-splicing factor of RES complex-domain-containing protein n=1 Tax=Crepidotus variabilis TaxID=179855 RepID=A0A9P6ENU6_9AGAR|nr:Pre-mRNA-splicing factor of RES complex-domain-containing protein [Crepidotus variabilis]
MSNLKSYLAEKYMSGPKADAILAKTAPQKKKKRKAKDSVEPSKSVMMMIDDDGGWGDAAQEEEDELVDAVVEKDRGFKKRKVANAAAAAAESSWITVQEGILKEAREGSLPPEEDDQPMVVDTDSTPAGAKRGGLMNPKDLQKILPQNNVIDAASTMTAEEVARAQETVYRDTSGKKIDTKAAKAEAARLKREREEKEAQKMEWGKGLVQKDEAEKQRKELERLRTAKFARGVDDTELNEDLKAKELWNDPAAAFLTKKRSKGPRRPAYTGPPPPPNRFNIKPGYRWDGVDRSNGFEKKYFQSLNAKKRKGAESYQWSVDDM